jgi:hypothetical protein
MSNAFVTHAPSLFAIGDDTFVVDGGSEAVRSNASLALRHEPDRDFAEALASIDESLLWCLHGARALEEVRALERAFARTPFFTPCGRAPLAPAAAVRLADLVDGHAQGAKLTIALTGDLELAALALVGRGHACTLVVEEDGAWSALAREHGVSVVVSRPEDPLPEALHTAFDVAFVDLAARADGLVQLLSRGLALVEASGLIGVVSHPRLRDKAMPALVDVLPALDEPALYVDFLPRVLPGPVKMGEHWDLFVLERDDDALPLGADESCSPARARDLDPDLFVMLAEEIHGLSRPLTDDDLARTLALLDAVGVRAESVVEQNGPGFLRRRLVLTDGAFLEIDAHQEHRLVTFCLGSYLPRRFLSIGMCVLATLPARQHEVRL